MDKNIHLIVDTIKENHFEPRNAKYFNSLCKNFAIHYGWYNIDSWATEIGNTHRDIAKYKLNGKPDWNPNVVITDLGRSFGGNNRYYNKNKYLKIWYCADEHRHHFNGNNNVVGQPYIEYAKQFDYIFLRQKSVMPYYPKNKTFWFPHSVQIESIPKNVFQYKYDIVFISGSITAERQNILDKLKGFNVFFKAGGLSEPDYMELTSLGRIAINRTQTNRGEVNKRIFEAMAAGCMLLTNECKDSHLEELFRDKVHLVVYKDEKHMLDLIKYYLGNTIEREKIAKTGYEEVMKNHTSDKRVKQIISFIYNKI